MTGVQTCASDLDEDSGTDSAGGADRHGAERAGTDWHGPERQGADRHASDRPGEHPEED